MESAIRISAVASSLRTNLLRMVAAGILVIFAAYLPGPLQAQTATGGTVSFSGGNEIHTFTSSGSFTMSAPSSVSVQVLVVAGGGGAGAGSSNNWGGGGGGAGGVVFSSFSVNPGNYSVVVGVGGAGGASSNMNGQNGGNSTFSTITAVGGGFGSGGGYSNSPGGNGGSGGGSGGITSSPAFPGGSGTSGQGNSGGSGLFSPCGTSGGSGGGAGSAGSNGAVCSSQVPGGTGASYSISGSALTYAAGGSGGAYADQSIGASGAANSGNGGSGGGGGQGVAGGAGGNGGSGIVIISFVPGTSGPSTPSSSAQNITAIRLNGIRFADQFPGSDIGAQVNNAINDCIPAPGVPAECLILVPAGLFNYGTTIQIRSPGISLVGAGSFATTLNYEGTGDAIQWQIEPFNVEQAGRISGFTIFGGGGARNGIHSGSIVGAQFDDLHITGFVGSGAAGILLENADTAGSSTSGPCCWTERNLFTRVHLDNNSIGLRMAVNGGTNSFGYNRFLDLRMNVNSGQIGISAEPGGVLYNATMIAMANVGGTGGTVLRLSGDPGSTTTWKDSFFNFTAECSNCANGTFLSTTANTSFFPMGNMVGLFGLSNSIFGAFQPVLNPSPDPSIASSGRPLFSTVSSGGANIATTYLPGDLPQLGSWLLADPNSAGNFLFGLGINVGWSSPGIWQLNGDTANNGGAAILGSNAGPLGFYMIPSTGGSPQTLTNSQLAADLAASLDTSGNFRARGIISGGGADFAESVAIHEDHQKYGPGDVLVIASGTREFQLSHEPYSRNVAGIYSTKPGLLGTDRPLGKSETSTEIPLAIVGIVPCKVTAENGSIRPGDLLVTSSTPGYAMKGTRKSKMLGAVMGKALEPLREGKGTILVLVALQ